MIPALNLISRHWRAVLAAACLALCLVNPAAAQTCSSPYTAVTSSLLAGPVCGTTCTPGTYPSMKSGTLTCEAGLAPPTCPKPDEFQVMTSDGSKCLQGYAPIESRDAQPACKPGDVRVQRTVYTSGNRQLADICSAGPSCPPGYLDTEDPDRNFGSNKVCFLPCQDSVLNQGMGCSCGEGTQLTLLPAGSGAQQACTRICGPGTKWLASSPLFANKAQAGSCVSVCDPGSAWSGDRCVQGAAAVPAPVIAQPAACQAGTHSNGHGCVPNVAPPICPPNSYWDGVACAAHQVLCPAGLHFNGALCVPNGPPLCGPNQHWNGVTCVLSISACPPNQYWNGNACIPGVLPPACGPNQHWNGNACAPNINGCPPNQHWNGSACVPNAPPPVCAPSQHWNGSACVPNAPPPVCPPNQHWTGNACVGNGPPPPQLCTAGHHWTPNGCVPDGFKPPVLCGPNQHLSGNACVPNGPPPPQLCTAGHHWTPNGCVPDGFKPPALCPPGQHWNGAKCTP